MAENTNPSLVLEIFTDFNTYLVNDQDTREKIREAVRTLEQSAREIMTVVQGVHQKSGLNDVSSLCNKARQMFTGIQNQFKSLQETFPADQYYKYSDHWRFAIQRLAFLAALIVYLETGKLVTREEVAQILGIAVKKEDGFHIDLEDFLHGLLTLANEMSRLAVNSVTAGDFERPLMISAFLNELDSGFRLLNLKNDSLRKRYDGLKYDVKKVEEVVYDISIRGLNSKARSNPPEEG